MPPKKYTTQRNADGQLVHTTFKVWRGENTTERPSGYSSFATEAEAREFYEQYGARLDREDITILDSKD